MNTKVLKPEEGLEYGKDLILAGEVVAFPTETVYGLGGNALSSDSIKKIYLAKGRPSDNPLIVHISEIDDIYPLVAEFSEANKKVANAFMPGPITLIFPKSEVIPKEITAGLNTVAIRMPAHKVARDFIRRCGVPIAAPSANTSTRISPTKAEHVYEDMQGKIPLIIDGGECEVGIESTVLDLTGDVPTILRPGAITAEMLLSTLDTVKTHTGETLSVAPAPGMKYKHYAPCVDTVLACNIKSAVLEYDKVYKEGKNAICLIREQDIDCMGERKFINLGGSDLEVCKNIYSAMRDAEKKYNYIICVDLGNDGVAGSIMNRLTKACGGKIV